MEIPSLPPKEDALINPDAGRSLRRYTRADLDPDLESFSNALRKRPPEFP